MSTSVNEAWSLLWWNNWMLFLGIQDPPVLVRLQISPLSHVPLGADVPVKQDNLKMSLQFTIGNNNFSYLHPPSTGVWTLRGYLVAPLTIHLAPLGGWNSLSLQVARFFAPGKSWRQRCKVKNFQFWRPCIFFRKPCPLLARDKNKTARRDCWLVKETLHPTQLCKKHKWG